MSAMPARDVGADLVSPVAGAVDHQHPVPALADVGQQRLVAQLDHVQIGQPQAVQFRHEGCDRARRFPAPRPARPASRRERCGSRSAPARWPRRQRASPPARSGCGWRWGRHRHRCAGWRWGRRIGGSGSRSRHEPPPRRPRPRPPGGRPARSRPPLGKSPAAVIARGSGIGCIPPAVNMPDTGRDGRGRHGLAVMRRVVGMRHPAHMHQLDEKMPALGVNRRGDSAPALDMRVGIDAGRAR